MNKKLLEAYLICLELAKENAFKCTVWIHSYDAHFNVTVKKNDDEPFETGDTFRFAQFDKDSEIDNKLEMLRTHINESI